jgi:starch-binding outer membrane protein SusE/F
MNKYLKVSVGLLLVAALIVFNCTKSDELNLNLTNIEGLVSPPDNTSIQLKISNLTTGSLVFEWDQAYAEDGSLVLYDVLFDQAGGDFANPFYITVSDGRGIQNKLTLPYSALNTIAAAGGAEFLQTKKFIWTARASKGSNLKRAQTTRTIEITRPLGIKNIPTALFLTGSGTEGGTTLANAVPMISTGPGRFEIYTRLSPGTYQMVDAITGTPNTYYSTVVDGATIVAENGQNTWSGTTGQYRFSVDFNTFGVTVPMQIKAIGYWYCHSNDTLATLKYKGRGLWEAASVPINLASVSWGFEERWKYRVYLGDGTNEFWGYQGNDSPGQDGGYPNFPASYLQAVKGPDPNDQWNYSWKFDKPAVNGKNVKFLLKFQAPGPYSMQYIVE